MDRFGQVKPKVLFAADGYYYNGKAHDSLAKIRQIADEIESLEQVVIVELVSDTPDFKTFVMRYRSRSGIATLQRHQISSLRSYPLIIRFTLCIPQGLPESPSASSTEQVARSFNT
jgi:acyl-coenzyme A synthetase/AMP-(fatty) acid ligase